MARAYARTTSNIHLGTDSNFRLSIETVEGIKMPVFKLYTEDNILSAVTVFCNTMTVEDLIEVLEDTIAQAKAHMTETSSDSEVANSLSV